MASMNFAVLLLLFFLDRRSWDRRISGLYVYPHVMCFDCLPGYEVYLLCWVAGGIIFLHSHFLASRI